MHRKLFIKHTPKNISSGGEVGEGRHLVSMWGKLVIFDQIYLLPSRCSVSQIVSSAETKEEILSFEKK